jgi:hypothetical protein
MKRFMTLAFIALVAISCKKDQATGTTVTVVAKWTVVKQVITEYADNMLRKTTVNAGKEGEYLSFKADLTGVSYTDDQAVNFTYVLSESTLSLTFPSNGLTQLFKITKLTDHVLELHYDNPARPKYENIDIVLSR